MLVKDYEGTTGSGNFTTYTNYKGVIENTPYDRKYIKLHNPYTKAPKENQQYYFNKGEREKKYVNNNFSNITSNS